MNITTTAKILVCELQDFKIAIDIDKVNGPSIEKLTLLAY